MRINAYLAETLDEADELCLKNIKPNSETKNIVIVPDRLSLLIEKKIMEVLNLKSVFNVDVMGQSRLILNLLNEFNLNEKLFTNFDGVMLVRDILSSETFNIFEGKISYELCKEIYETISQIKSSNVKPEDLKISKRDILLSQKLDDIKKIYNIYEQSKKEKLDPSDLLTFFFKNFDKDLSDYNFYFVGFDSFTSLGFNLFTNLAKKANSVSISIAYSENMSNSYIYEKDILTKVKQFALLEETELNVFYGGLSVDEKKLAIRHNLFAKELKKFSISKPFFFAVKAKSKRDEVEFLAKNIRYGIYNGKRFMDYNVALSCIDDYKDLIKEIFSLFEIPYNIDVTENLMQSTIANFVISLLESVSLKGSGIKALIGFPYLNVSDLKKREIIEKNLKGTKALEILDNKYLSDFINKVKVADSVSNMAQILKEFLSTEMFISFISNEDNGEERYFEVLNDVLNKIREYKFKATVDEFISLLKFAFESTNVSDIPKYYDCVFVGDATKSYFEKGKRLFILGASANQLPRTQTDIGLLSDNELKKISASSIEPTIKMINRRNRFKIFNLICDAGDEIVCSFVSLVDGKAVMPSGFVTDLLNTFEINGTKCNAINTADFLSCEVNSSINSFLFNLGSKQSAKMILAKGISRHDNYLDLLQSSLYYALDKELPKSKDSHIITANEVEAAFSGNQVSVSQIETFYKCPFMYFCKYVLKLQNLKSLEFDAGTYGSFMHRAAELYVKAKLNGSTFNIDEIINNSFIWEYLDYADIFKGILKNDINKLIRDIDLELANSGFKPIFFEEKFSQEINLNGKKLTFTGYVDRIDSFGDYIRVIDYKTGKKHHILKELYYGEKLQLFMYGKMAADKFGKKLAGVFYFNSNYSFSDSGKEKVLNGIYLKEEDILKSLDLSLGADKQDSEIINLKLNKDLSPSKASGLMDNKSLDRMLEYSYRMFLDGINEVLSGNTKASPIKDACKFCDYRNLCCHDVSFGDKIRNCDQKIEEESFGEMDV